MKREDLARKLARETRQSSAQAQDQIDDLGAPDIRKSMLREGRTVPLPGVGKLKTKRASR